MAEVLDFHIKLVLGWDDLGATAGLRRNQAGFSKIKEFAETATEADPLVINAFLYAFLCPAKNFDLFLREDLEAISGDVRQISRKMAQLTEFEREARALMGSPLRELYLALRNVVARHSARDERRTLATLLFSGPSSVDEIAMDLGISCNLAGRAVRTLAAVLVDPGAKKLALKPDTDSLAVILHLLRGTIGSDPLAVLERRLAATR